MPFVEFDAGYVLFGLIVLCAVCAYAVAVSDDADLKGDEGDEFAPKPPLHPEDAARLTAF
ncbi:hypothetical protein OIU35_31755 [Boseaceae bacterium BT-24-1]|nr:hypothetical protein [Boseaceae bacterium BT-24-1]